MFLDSVYIIIFVLLIKKKDMSG